MADNHQNEAEKPLFQAENALLPSPPEPVSELADHDIPDKPNRFLPKAYVRMVDSIKRQYIDLVCKTGLLTQSAIDVGVSVETARMHRNNDEEFGEAVKTALDVYRDSIEKEVHRRGVVGVDQPVFYMGEQCGVMVKYSDRMLEMHAKRLIPEYRDHVSVDANVTGGVMVIPAGPQSVEDWESQNNTPLEVIDVTEVAEVPATRDVERS